MAADGLPQDLANRISDGLHMLAERIRKDPSARLVCKLDHGSLQVTVKGIALITPMEDANG